MLETLKLAGEADALGRDGLDARSRSRLLVERHPQAGEDAPPIRAVLDQKDDEGILDLAARRSVGPHDEGQLRRSFATYLAIDRDLAAEVRVRRDRFDDAHRLRLRVRDAPGGAPAFPVSFGDTERLDEQPQHAHLGAPCSAPPRPPY